MYCRGLKLETSGASSKTNTIKLYRYLFYIYFLDRKKRTFVSYTSSNLNFPFDIGGFLQRCHF